MAFIPAIVSAMSASTALAAVGTTLSVIGGIRQGNAAMAQANTNARVARDQASAEEARTRRDNARRMGTLRASIAKSGVTSEGTPLLALAESAENAELDALNIRWGGAVKSDRILAEGRDARDAAFIGAGTSLLSGAGKINKMRRT